MNYTETQKELAALQAQLEEQTIRAYNEWEKLASELRELQHAQIINYLDARRQGEEV